MALRCVVPAGRRPSICHLSAPKSMPMATQSKAQFLNDVHALLKKRYKPKPDRNAPRLSVLEAVIYGICHEDTTREQANQALSRFKDDFFDWNEVRVSSIEEIQGAARRTLARSRDPRFPEDPPIPPAVVRAYLWSSPSRSAAQRKPLKESIKVLQEYEGVRVRLRDGRGDPAVARRARDPGRSRHSSGARACSRDGVAEADVRDFHSLRAVLERKPSPRTAGLEFADLIEELAYDTCVEGVPDLSPLRIAKDLPHRPHPQGRPASSEGRRREPGKDGAQRRSQRRDPSRHRRRRRPSPPSRLPPRGRRRSRKPGGSK